MGEWPRKATAKATSMLKFINLPSTMDVVKHVEKQVEKATSML
jgi:hypothetical protein